jgi:hypothetical protein
VTRIIDITPSTVERLDPAEVARALGADPTPAKVPDAPNQITRFVLRAELFRRLQSTGGRPGLEGNNLRRKIPLSDQEWHQLEALASQIAATTKLSPSPGQVGSVLLSLAIRSVLTDTEGNGSAEATTELLDELSARGNP